MNLGLHYSPRGMMFGTNYQTLFDDMSAALTFLVTFTNATDDRIAIWRSDLPQHFQTSDGSYDEKEIESSINQTCVTAKDYNQPYQPYNKLYEEVFMSLCNSSPKLYNDNEQLQLECGNYWHSCIVNVTSHKYYTIYMYWLRNNMTNELESIHKRRDNRTVGKILNWNIYDLFDEAAWHTGDRDCTHFCFVPPMFEAAFHQLDLLLSATT